MIRGAARYGRRALHGVRLQARGPGLHRGNIRTGLRNHIRNSLAKPLIGQRPAGLNTIEQKLKALAKARAPLKSKDMLAVLTAMQGMVVDTSRVAAFAAESAVSASMSADAASRAASDASRAASRAGSRSSVSGRSRPKVGIVRRGGRKSHSG